VATIESEVRVVANILWNLFYRVSTFVNIVMCVAKTTKVKYPFYHIRMKIALFAITAYLLLWMPVAAFQYHEIINRPQDNKDMKHASISYGQLGVEIGGYFFKKYDLPNMKNGIKTYYGAFVMFIFILIPFIVPSIISLACLVILVTSLRKPAPNAFSTARQKYVTITVTSITFIFVVCTSISTLYQFIAKIVIAIILGKKINERVNQYLYPLFHLTLPLVNAAFGTLIILLRSRELKTQLKQFLTSAREPAQSKTTLIMNPIPEQPDKN
jgi:hypothetical protein